MKTYILGDYHGRSLEAFREEVSVEEIDHLMSTGDFDQVETIHEFLELREDVEEENVDEVGGNHDHALLEGRKIKSGAVTRQQQTWPEMVQELRADREAMQYLEELMEEKEKYVDIHGRNGILAHGGVTGYLQNPGMPDEEKPLWYRLWHEEEFEETFDQMENRNADILVRGHDHWTEHAYHEPDGEIDYNLPEPGDSITLDSDQRHIITHGPWNEGIYATIEEKDSGKLELAYHQVDF
jgi:predicted phosphodiesterase